MAELRHVPPVPVPVRDIRHDERVAEARAAGKGAHEAANDANKVAADRKRGKVDDSSLVGRRVRAGGCFTHDLNPTPYDGEVESHDAATNTYVVYWPADDSETVYTERQLRRVLV